MNRGKHKLNKACTVGFPAVHMSIKGSYYINPFATALVIGFLGYTPTNVTPDYDRKTRTVILNFNRAANFVRGNSKLTESPEMNRLAFTFAGGDIHDKVVARLENVFDHEGMFYGILEVDSDKEFGDDGETRFIVRLSNAPINVRSFQENAEVVGI